MTTPTTNTKRAPRKRHGLDTDAFRAILERQGSRCAICGETQIDEPGRRLALDHDHAHCPGKSGCPECVRGLLCIHCNNILRSAKDDPAILRWAIGYLEGERPRRGQSPDALAMLFDDDYRLLPTQGRRDRLYMHLLEDPFSPESLAEASWMEKHDPTGLAMAMARMNRPGREGAFEAVDGVNLEDINAYLRRTAREDRLDEPTE